MSGRWIRLMPLSGIVFVALILASILVSSNSPGDTASPAKVIDFYHRHQTSQRVSGLLTIIAIVVGVFFFGVLRSRLRQREGNEQFAAMAFGGAIIFAVSGGISAGIQFALADVPTRLNAGAAQALNVLQNNFSFALTTAGISALTLTTAVAVLRSRMMPQWIGWLSVVIGVVALAGPIGWFAFLALGPWAVILSIVLYRTGDQPSVITLPQVPAQTTPADQPSMTPRS